MNQETKLGNKLIENEINVATNDYEKALEFLYQKKKNAFRAREEESTPKWNHPAGVPDIVKYETSKKYKEPRQRKKAVPSILTEDEMLRVIEGERNFKRKVTMALLYLFCLRVSEALLVKKKDIVEDTKDGDTFLTCTAINKKNRSVLSKELPMLIETPLEKMCAAIIRFRLAQMGDNDRVLAYENRIAVTKDLKEHVVVTVRKIDPKTHAVYDGELKVFSHYLRAVRLTHLALQDISPFILQQYAGWSSTNEAKYYVRLTTDSIRKARLKTKNGAS